MLVNRWSLHLLVFYAGLVVYLLFVALVVCCMLVMLWLIDLMFDSLFDGGYGALVLIGCLCLWFVGGFNSFG